MSKITGKVNYKEVLKGDTGYTFEPHVTVDGILYWTNNGNLDNPLPVNLHGKQGFMFIPHVDSEGNLSWTNTGELENPPTVNIKGDKGYFYTPHISQDGILTWSNNGGLENPQPFNISDLILNEVKESRVDTTGKTFSKLKERLDNDFKKLSESIKNNDTKDEVVQARTATTGENFMTLDDRIDHEVMRLREKIEVTMLEQEDKGNHVIENTVDGMTTDMIVKGRTLQNLSLSNENKWRLTGEYAIRVYKYDLLKPNTKYTFILEKFPNGADTPTWFINASGIEDSYGNNLIKVVTTSNNFAHESTIHVMVRNPVLENIDSNYNPNLIILEGDWSNKPIPQYFEGIKSFGQQEDKISILSKGKNLFDGELEQGVYNSSTGEKQPDATAIRSKNKILLCSGTYFFSNNKNVTSRVFIYDLSGKFLRTTIEKQITLSSNSLVSFHLGLSVSTEISTIQVQIEEGTQATHYESYRYDKKDILLQDLGFDEGLRGINSISDEINYIRKVAIKRIGKREYRDGDLLLDNVITNKVNTYYVLDEQIETPLDESIALKIYNEKTYVNFENSIKGTSSFKVPVNTNKLINDLKFEKEDLKEKFNNLTNEFENFKTYMIQILPYKEV